MCQTQYNALKALKSLLSSTQHIHYFGEIFVYYSMATKKVPQRRNKNAGKSTGKSKSAKYFAKNKAARDKKNAYNSEYHSSTKRKKYRAKLNKANRDKPNGKGQDKSHTKAGKLVNEKRSTNRARNGRGGKAKKK